MFGIQLPRQRFGMSSVFSVLKHVFDGERQLKFRVSVSKNSNFSDVNPEHHQNLSVLKFNLNYFVWIESLSSVKRKFWWIGKRSIVQKVN
jgi:hypothetical protein